VCGAVGAWVAGVDFGAAGGKVAAGGIAGEGGGGPPCAAATVAAAKTKATDRNFLIMAELLRIGLGSRRVYTARGKAPMFDGLW